MLSEPRYLAGADMVLWSKSRALMERFDQGAMLDAAQIAGVPTVAFHLDRWWGLARSVEVGTDPFFRCDLVVTTDGGNDDKWAAAGVNHRWLPPATTVAATRWEPRPRPDLVGKVVFVGESDLYAHPEWRYRQHVVAAFQRRFGPRFVRFPGRDRRRIAGQELADVIAAAGVVVGDSNFAGGSDRYWSDRVPITLGMGGLLVHPDVAGMGEWFRNGVHLWTAPVGDPDGLCDTAERVLGEPDETVRETARRAVIDGHTFDVRARQLVEMAEAL